MKKHQLIHHQEYMVAREPTKNQFGRWQTSISFYPSNTFPQEILCTVYGKTKETCIKNAKNICRGMNIVYQIKEIRLSTPNPK